MSIAPEAPLGSKAKLFVGNLSESVRSEDVEVLFKKYGNVVECTVFKTYGFVHLDNEGDAQKAVKELRGSMLHGKPMNVEYSNSPGGAGGGTRKIREGRKPERPVRFDPYSVPTNPYDRYDPCMEYPKRTGSGPARPYDSESKRKSHSTLYSETGHEKKQPYERLLEDRGKQTKQPGGHVYSNILPQAAMTTSEPSAKPEPYIDNPVESNVKQEQYVHPVHPSNNVQQFHQLQPLPHLPPNQVPDQQPQMIHHQQRLPETYGQPDVRYKHPIVSAPQDFVHTETIRADYPVQFPTREQVPTDLSYSQSQPTDLRMSSKEVTTEYIYRPPIVTQPNSALNSSPPVNTTYPSTVTAVSTGDASEAR